MSLRIKFKEISVPITQQAKGIVSLEIAEPLNNSSNEFLMISRWLRVEDVKDFAGENWNEAFIPEGMERYIKDYSVSHFENIELN